MGSTNLSENRRMPSIGDMRSQVAIKTITKTADGQGGFTEAWTTTLDTVWAYVNDISAAERYRGMQQEHRRVLEVWIRYRSDFDATARLIWNGNTIRINSIDYVEDRNRFLRITGEVLMEGQ